MRRYVFKIVSEPDWARAMAAGLYTGSADDRRDGFIHFSDADQVAGTLDKHFAGQRGLLLVLVEGVALGDDLRWEVSRGGRAFPHLYAALPVSAVRAVAALPDGVSGAHAGERARAMIDGLEGEGGDAA